jgi:hypothetical protein
MAACGDGLRFTAVVSDDRPFRPRPDPQIDAAVRAFGEAMKTIRARLPLVRRRRQALACALSLAAGLSAAHAEPPQGGWGIVGGPGQAAGQKDALRAQEAMSDETLQAFRAAISAVTQMPNDGALQSRAERLGLNVLNVLWEDTGRFAGSSVGPNISDVTLQVREPAGGGFRTHLLPVIRFPNFSDKTADIEASKLWIKVGNQRAGGQVVTVPLTEVLAHLREYLTDPDSVLGGGNLLAARDTHFLVSAQHVFVPIPKQGKAEFNPVIFNYQSSPKNPAVLTLLATRQGTSVAVIENSGGDQSFQGWGQQLFFNNQGQKTTFTAERKSDVKARIDSGQTTAQDAGALDDGADMLLIIQVPLKFIQPPQRSAIGGLMSAEADGGAIPEAAAAPSMQKAVRGAAVSDVEQAVIGHGADLGPVVEGNALKLERDDRFPVRVTVQFYKATSNGVVSDRDLKDAKAQIDKVYAAGDYVGSLVVPEGARHRPTDWHLGKTPLEKPSTPTATPSAPATPTAPPTPTDASTVEPGPSPPSSPEPSAWERFKSWLFG